MDRKKGNAGKKGGRIVRKKKDIHYKRLVILYAAIMLLALCGLGGGLSWAFLANGRADLTARLEESSPEETSAETLPAAAAGEETPAQKETETEPETETQEQDVYVELTPGNIRDYVRVDSCEILPGTGRFQLKAQVEEKPVSDDDFFYLIEMKMYENELDPERDYLAAAKKDREFTLEAGVNENRANSRLYSKFVVAVKLDGAFVALCEPQYICNPEALAAYDDAFPKTSSIKGILVDPMKLGGSELDDLGVKHAAYNIPVSNILGKTTNGAYPTIYYDYNGKTYAFNGQRISEYDYVFRTLTQKNIVITAILLNNKSGAQPQLIHPLSRNGSGHYYAFNTAEEDGIQTMAAVGSFLAQRYRDREHGTVMNWIVGNEVNVRSDWNYMQYVDLDTYAEEYAKAVRVFYNSIKSMNANARIYVSMDQQWDRNLESNGSYDVKDLLASFNQIVSREGNIDWGLAHHPYAYPLNNTTFWNSSSKIDSLITDSENTSIVTMQNIQVVTDYMQREEMLTAKGEVRPIILSELGYSSAKGETNQAAAFAYAYYAAESNPYIDAMILSRQTDASEEVAQGLSLGLSFQGGRHKFIYEVFKNIDQPGSEGVTEFAKTIIGIQNWSEVTGES